MAPRTDAPAVRAATTVLLCSTQPLLRIGLRAVLERQPDLQVVDDVPGADAAERRPHPVRPDVAVIDARGPSDRGAAAIRAIRASQGCRAQVVAVTEPDIDIRQALRLLQAGASALVDVDDPAPQVIQAIRAVAAGQALLTPTVTRRLLDSYLLKIALPPAPETAVLAGLSPREREIFGLVAKGLSNAEIARHLTISERTVKFHVSNLLAKLNLRDRVQAAVLAGTIAS